MALRQEQEEVLREIDTILTLTEQIPKFDIDNIQGNISLNPINYLISIIEKMVTKEELIDWLVNYLTKYLPYVELAVKTAILTNLKRTVDCLNDPRIPAWMRLPAPYTINGDDVDFFDEGKCGGLLFNPYEIDYNSLFSINPLAEEEDGISHHYFGCNTYYCINDENVGANGGTTDYTQIRYASRQKANQECLRQGLPIVRLNPYRSTVLKFCEVDSIYELIRARDMNAFLWLVMNKGELIHWMKPSEIVTGLSLKDGDNTNLYEYFSVNSNSVAPKDAIWDVDLGTTVSGNELTYSLCYKRTVSKGNGGSSVDKTSLTQAEKNVNLQIEAAQVPSIYTYEFLPYSVLKGGYTWYANKELFFEFLKPVDARTKVRDYSKDKGLCVFRYFDKASKFPKNNFTLDTTRNAATMYNMLQFAILPKPLQNTLGRPICYDAKGKPSIFGKYSAKVNYAQDINEFGDKYIGWRPEVTWKGKTPYYKTFDEKYNINAINGKIKNKDFSKNVDTLPSEYLYECYPNLTVYEFNFDYVMSIELFDPVVVVTQLIEAATNLLMNGGLNLGFKVSKTETQYQMRISEIVDRVINQDATSTVNDCFFSFSNEQYDELLRKSEAKRSQGYEFQDANNHQSKVDTSAVMDILSEFDNNGTLEKNQDVLRRAFTQVTASVTEEVLPEDRYNIEFNLIVNMIKMLVNIIVETLLSPKLVMLFIVNRELMGGSVLDKNPFGKEYLEQLFESLIGLIIAIVSEIRDLIIKALLDWVMKILLELLSDVSLHLIKEQLEYYRRLMRLLLKACAFKFPKRANLPSELDKVDYADIDPVDSPPTEEC